MNIPKKYLTEKVILTESRVDSNSILRILTQNTSINQNDPNIEYYKKLASWADKHQSKTGPINLSAIKLSDDSLITNNKLARSANHLGHTLNQLNILMSREGKYNPSDAKSSLIQKTTLEILASLSGIKGELKPVEEPKEAPKEDPEEENNIDQEDVTEKEGKNEPNGNNESDDSSATKPTDWTAEKARRLANSGDKTTSEVLEQFYNDYYKLEYASLNTSKEVDIVAKLKSLDKILIQEFNKLGYNPEVNPFAQFLKNLIEHKMDIFLKLNTNTYGAIHNSFIRQYITGNLLGIYSDKNILFCSDLYKHRGLDIVNYLYLYNQIIRSAKSNNKYSGDPEILAAKVLIQQEPRDNNYKENVRKLLADKNNINLPASDNVKMRSELEISELYNHIFKTTLKKQLANRDIDEICFEAEKQQIMRAMVKYILDLDVLATREQADYESWFSKLKYTPNEANIKNSEKLLSGYELDHSAHKLLKQLKIRIEAENVKVKADA